MANRSRGRGTNRTGNSRGRAGRGNSTSGHHYDVEQMLRIMMAASQNNDQLWRQRQFRADQLERFGPGAYFDIDGDANDFYADCQEWFRPVFVNKSLKPRKENTKRR